MKLSKLQATLIVLLPVLLLVGTASALSDDDRIVMRDSPHPLTKERIPIFLVLDEQTQQSGSLNHLRADTMSRQAQVLQTVRAVDSTALKTARPYWIANAVWLEVDPADLDQLVAIPGVSHIEPDLTITLNDPVTEIASTITPDSIQQPERGYATVWSADFIEAPSVWKSGNTGEGVTIAIIDTGIDGDHPAFGDRILKFVDFVNSDGSAAYDDHGHGTHCAGTAAGGTVTVTTGDGRLDVTLGVAPEANLIGAKVLNNAGSGSFSTVFDGVQWAVDNGADVVSMSLGTYISRDKSCSNLFLAENASRSVTLEVSSEMHEDTKCLYEPHFVIGSIRVEDRYHLTTTDSDSASPLENLTITLTDARGNAASGARVDWLGFDQKENRYCFKAPYNLNTEGWDGVWRLTVTNTGVAEVRVDEIKLSECYQSNGETILDATVDTIVKGGTIVVLPAGNDGWCGTASINTPGTAKDAITVGATDYLMDYRASFSSMGPVNRAAPYVKPDIMAPGVGIISAYPEGQYASMQGTSMACPAVAGAAALMLSGNSSLTPADVKSALMETAVHIDEDGIILPVMRPNNAYGAGRINAYEAVNSTGGLGEIRLSDGVQHELFGGALTPHTSNTLPVMAILWNTTAGMPMAGEDVDVSVWYYDSHPHCPVYTENQTLTTDADGYMRYDVDISSVPESSSVYVRIAHDELWVEDSVHKQPATSAPAPVVPIFEPEHYALPHNSTVEIRYPLMSGDGSPYVENVSFMISNSSQTIVEEELAPVDGVIMYSLDLIGQPLDETYYCAEINERSAGHIHVGEDGYTHQKVVALPPRAICPPGESVDLGIMAWTDRGEKTVSREFDVCITTLTRTEVLSLSSAGTRRIPDPDRGDMQAFLAEITGMKPETHAGTVSLMNGIGLINFTMPKDGYIAIVRFVSPYDSMPTILVYGTLEPWLMHRSTQPIHKDFYDGDLTYIESTYDWPAHWDQDAYTSIPADKATITAHVFTLDPVTGSSGIASGQAIYLYTESGAQIDITDADGCCTFTVDTIGKAQVDYLLATAGVYGSARGWIGCTPFDLTNLYSVSPGLIENEFVASVRMGVLYPDSEMRSISVTHDGDAYDVIVRGYGPDGEPIRERGIFTLNRLSGTPTWDSVGTEVAAVVEFTGTETRRVIPAAAGSYQAEYGLLDSNTRGIDRNLHATFCSPDQTISYVMPDSILIGTPVPVTFDASTSDGAPVAGARIVLAAGAAGDRDLLSYYGRDFFSFYGDPRDANILFTTDWRLPDPYTTIVTGYTDASGRATLTLPAPTSSQQALRESFARASEIVPYTVLCYHDSELLQEDSGYLKLTPELLPDFIPDVSAPRIAKLERDGSIPISNVTILIKNVGTADYVYDGVGLDCATEIGPHSESTCFEENLATGEARDVIPMMISCNACDFGIDTDDCRLPFDINIGVTINSNRTVRELSYQNNYLVYPIQVTAPDLAVEVVAPRYTMPTNTTAIGIRVANLGEVASNAATLCYSITGEPEVTSTVPALMPGESASIWVNRTLAAGDYQVSAEINRAGVTDYETTFANNHVSSRISSYVNPATRVDLPGGIKLVPGTTYDLPITVSEVSNLAAYQVDLTFNGSILEVESILPGPLGMMASNIMNGSISFNGVALSGIGGDVTIATVRFKVIGTMGGETALDMTVELWDTSILTIPVEVVNGSAHLLIYGDANEDGRVDQADTLLVLKQVVGLEGKPEVGTPEFLVTDVTGNGAIDVGDAMFIAQYNVGLRDTWFEIKHLAPG